MTQSKKTRPPAQAKKTRPPELADAMRLPALASLAAKALSLWDLPAGATPRLINLSENATFLVEAGSGYRRILRVHRAGYNSPLAIESELAWMAALQTEKGASSS